MNCWTIFEFVELYLNLECLVLKPLHHIKVLKCCHIYVFTEHGVVQTHRTKHNKGVYLTLDNRMDHMGHRVNISVNCKLSINLNIHCDCYDFKKSNRYTKPRATVGFKTQWVLYARPVFKKRIFKLLSLDT